MALISIPSTCGMSPSDKPSALALAIAKLPAYARQDALDLAVLVQASGHVMQLDPLPPNGRDSLALVGISKPVEAPRDGGEILFFYGREEFRTETVIYFVLRSNLRILHPHALYDAFWRLCLEPGPPLGYLPYPDLELMPGSGWHIELEQGGLVARWWRSVSLPSDTQRTAYEDSEIIAGRQPLPCDAAAHFRWRHYVQPAGNRILGGQGKASSDDAASTTSPTPAGGKRTRKTRAVKKIIKSIDDAGGPQV